MGPPSGGPDIPQAHPNTAAALAVVIGPAGVTPGQTVRAAGLHGQQVRLVRALLSSSAGREVEGPYGDASLVFDDWRAAVETAMSLTSQLLRMPTELGGIQVRIGLELADTPADPSVLAQAARHALSATRSEIRLGDALAVLVRRDPPDRMSVRAVDTKTAAAGNGVYRLTPANHEVPNNLNGQLTSFVGRELEIGAVVRLLEVGPLVTITGPPGIGKSRLATEIAERRLGRYDGGAWFVPLAPIGDPRLVMSTVAETLGVPVPPGVSSIDAVVAYIKPRRMLVVLDNFEHLPTAGPELADLIAAAPGLQLVVTSRTALHLPDEQEFALVPFDVPSADWRFGDSAGSAATDLFVHRAAASEPSFRLGEDNAVLVRELCRRLDGLPLAIELAAARMRLLPLEAILPRLDDRLSLLSGGPRDHPARHQSLRAAIAWSYDLLDPPEQRLFRRLSVFRGGWTIEGATAMSASDPDTAADALDALASLQDVSLLVRQGPVTAAPRLAMLETLREFAAERLEEAGESEAVRRLHASHYLGLVARLGPQLTGPDQAAALDRLAAEHDNIRAALGHLLAAGPVDALRMTASIWRFWQMRGHLAEGSRWVADALRAAGDDAPDGDRANALAAAGGLAYWQGDLLDAERQYEQAVVVRRRIGDDVGVADALYDLAFVFDPSLRPPPEDPERTAAGIRIAEEAHDRYVNAGHEPGVAKSEWLLGSVTAEHDLDRAVALLRSSVGRFRQLTDLFGLGWALHSYGLVLLRSTDSDSAAHAFGEALGLFAAAGDSSATALLLDDFAEVAKAEGEALRAARLKGAASGMRHATQAELVVANAPWLLADTITRGLVDPAALERAWLEGQALSQTEAISFALRSDADTVPDRGLRVSALGPLIVERGGEPISDWGGPKAGNRHALAIFAFLIDRGERGVSKDEFVEVLWPDAEVQQGDLNFHRTLGGLRATLNGDSPSDALGSVMFANGRYRLRPAIVSWSDVAEFERRLLSAAEATDDISAIRGLEAARALYRGDYLDDCPLYGDSGYVEEHRRLLRGRLVDALVELGRRYETRHDESLASARYREALAVSGGACPSASEGLARLGVAAT